MAEVFGVDHPGMEGPLYDFALCAPDPSTTLRDGLCTLSGIMPMSAADTADTLVVPHSPGAAAHPEVIAAIRRAHARGARLLAFHAGVLTLAAAGVLDGRRATTHWQLTDELRAEFPKVLVEPDVLYVDDGDILTAAGSSAVLDLALHLVRRDHGADAGCALGRRLTFSVHRDGGQRQFVERPLPETRDESLAPLLSWLTGVLEQPLTVADLAARAGVSPATLHRRFQAQLSTTPLAYLNRVRVTRACRIIEGGEARLEVVARRSGLGTATNLRALMRRETGLSPSEYRRRFATTG
ncbi:GlxA family transcriptional regulator [Virgisporangium aliadipatigenens]|uniref:GlxA family transcriptional regulator n=1 Tax=Virgisporangium aliadipatigenens TaxID=741659 RepID=UPI001EF33FAA|nr:helix-turn-helix domain-containing protein [Virgisporangium aliadipatigenens]